MANGGKSAFPLFRSLYLVLLTYICSALSNLLNLGSSDQSHQGSFRLESGWLKPQGFTAACQRFSSLRSWTDQRYVYIMRGIAEWFIYGEVDWEYWQAKLKEWGPLVAGALFGAGWWCWLDAVIYQKAVVGEGFPFKYSLPGIVATLALILMNLLSRDQLNEASESGEEGADFRARLWLFFTLLVAVGAVGGSVAVLVSCAQSQQLVSVGVGSVLQCGLILAAALLFWSFRSGESDGYSYISY